MTREEIIKAADICYDIIEDAWCKTGHDFYDTTLTVLANIELIINPKIQ